MVVCDLKLCAAFSELGGQNSRVATVHAIRELQHENGDQGKNLKAAIKNLFDVSIVALETDMTCCGIGMYVRSVKIMMIIELELNTTGKIRNKMTKSACSEKELVLI